MMTYEEMKQKDARMTELAKAIAKDWHMSVETIKDMIIDCLGNTIENDANELIKECDEYLPRVNSMARTKFERRYKNGF